MNRLSLLVPGQFRNLQRALSTIGAAWLMIAGFVVDSAKGAPITPTTVKATSYWVAVDGNHNNVINGSGLSGGGSVLAQTHNNASNASTMWHGGPNDGGLGGPTGNPPTVSGQRLEFDLGGSYALTNTHVWNHNQPTVTGRGVRNFEIWTSPDTSSAFTKLGDFVLNQGTGSSGLAAQVLTTSVTNVRRVQFRVQTVWSGASNDYVGLSEVRFEGSATPAPTVTAISPTSGITAGGTSVTITGTDFTGATAVTIGGAAATGVTVNSATQITATTPAGSAGTASVLVTTPGGTNAANSLFTYVAPVTATYSSATDVPVTAAGYTAAGGTVNFTLSYAPTAGTQLTVVNNTGTSPISGEFSNLANGATVNMTFGGTTYPFSAWYFGGDGNDLVLLWRYAGLAAWGNNSNGRLGDGTTTQRNAPVATNLTGVLAGKTIVQVVRGSHHSLALTTEGKVYAWGWNGFGQLGDNTGTERTVPVAVNTATGVSALFGKTVTAIAAGEYHSLALCSDGTVAAWGHNGEGALGDNSTTQRNAPVAVNTATALSGKTVKAIAAGQRSSLALCSDGTLASWGMNGNGQLGDNSTNQRNAPVTVNSSTALSGKTVTAISMGAYHSLALCSDGTVAAWGYNEGTLGDNTTNQRNLPVAVNTASGTSALFGKTVVAISAGDVHSLALCSDGTLASWGRGNVGQLGDNTTNQRNAPVAVNRASGVSALFGKTVTAIAGGSEFSLALASDGTVATWGRNGNGQLGDDSTTQRNAPVAVNTTSGISVLSGVSAKALSASSLAGHSLAIFGSPLLPVVNSISPDNGQSLGGTTVTITGTRFTGATGVSFGGVAATSFSVVDDTTITAVTSGGSIGTASVVVSNVTGPSEANSLFTYTTSTLAATYSSAADVPFTAAVPVAAGGTVNFTLGFEPVVGTQLMLLNNTGTSPIGGEFSNLANGATVNMTFGGTTYAFSAWYFGGDGNDLVLLWRYAGLAAWGDNGNGRLGDGTTTQRNAPVSTNLTGALAGKTIVQVARGFNYSVALTTEGKVYAWGWNALGQLGDNTGTDRRVPVAVHTASGSALFGKTVTAIAAGDHHCLALCSDGTVAAWGHNGEGRLGDNSTTQRNAPVAVNTASGVSALFGKTVKSVAAGGSHSMALCSDGTLVSWGLNGNGQLGDGSTGQRIAPVAVNMTTALSGKTVTGIAMGFYHSLALCSDGTVAAWGYNEGTLGDNTTSQRNLPTAVNTSNGTSALFGKTVVAISAGDYHSLALCSDGTLASWGRGNGGQLGDNTTNQRNAPVAVNRASGVSALFGKTVTAIAGGAEFSLALASDGTVAAWGRNGNGQLGDNTTTQRNAPAAVNTTTGISVLSGLSVKGLHGGPMGVHSLAIFDSPLPPAVDSISPDNGSTLGGTSVTITGKGFNRATGVSFGGMAATSFSVVNDTTITAVTSGGTVGTASVVVSNITGPSEANALFTYTTASFAATYASATDVPLTAAGPVAAGGTVNFTLNYEPVVGTQLMLLNNTGTNPISGEFSNLANGATVNLTYAGTTYPFSAWYFGGDGNDLVLLWRTALAAWGNNGSRQLGDSTNTQRNAPVATDLTGVLAGKTLVQVVSGSQHTLALTTEGKVYAWGTNGFGNLGDNSNTERAVPVAVNTASGVSALFGKTVTAIAACSYHSLALCSDGTVAAWGLNGFGQLGINSTNFSSNVPVAVHTAGALSGKKVTAIAAGEQHCLALCSDGTMVAWGIGGNGQLGDNTTNGRIAPVAVSTAGALSGKTVKAIAAGGYHNVALCSDSTLVAWGAGGNGQLGDNAGQQRNAPVLVNTTSGVSALFGKTVTAIAAGIEHSLAICSDGTVAAWGRNANGQLGDNSTNQRNAPVVVNTADGVSALFGKTVTAIAGGQEFSLALASDGTVAAWGQNANGQLGDNTTTQRNAPRAVNTTIGISVLSGLKAQAIATAAASHHSLAIVSAPLIPVVNSISPDNGQSLGDTSVTITGKGFTGASGVSFGGVAATSFSIVNDTTITAVTSGGTVGTASVVVSNITGPSEANSLFTYTTATLAATYTSATDVPVTAAGPVAAGGTVNFTLSFEPLVGTQLMVINNTGTGPIGGEFTNLANGATVNLTFGGVTYPFSAWYFGGDGNDLVLLWRNTVLAVWGNNGNGRLGDGTTTQRNAPVATNLTGVLADKTIVQVVRGSHHSLALTTEGKVYAWGWNAFGQLGDNTGTDRTVPVAVNMATGVSALFGKTVTAIAAGELHSLALCSDGTVAAWGNNGEGALGDSSTTQRNAPVAVNTATALSGKTVKAIAAGQRSSLALCSDGTLASWGMNGNGQLGDNSTAQRNAPVTVNSTTALSGKTVTAISMGAYHSLALCSDGTVAAWGNNEGTLGDNTTNQRNTPVAVNTVSGVSSLFGKTVVAISAGDVHSLALCSDGTLASWGRGNVGQLGDNTTNQRNAPVAVNSASGVSALFGKTVTAIAGGSEFSLALASDGTVASWGRNGNGQLGDNTTTQRNAPVAVSTASGISVLAGVSAKALSAGPIASHSLAIYGKPNNSNPTDIVLSADIIAENNAANATVGTLSTTDADSGDSFIYSLAGGADDSAFTITGNSLKLNASADFETKSSYTVLVRSTDQGLLYFEKEFNITITNVIEIPTVTSPSIASLTASGATLGGEVSDVSDPGTEIGIVYAATATNGNPLIGGLGVTKVTGTGTTGVFTVAVTGLASGTGYTFKAYATNGAGTGYSAADTFTVDKAAQTISFTDPDSKTYGDAPFALVATGGGSGNPVTFSIVTGPATVSGNTLTITGAGDVTVRASQAGNGAYYAASDVEQTFTVAPKALTITAQASSKVYGDADPVFTYTADGLLPGDSLTGALSREAGTSVGDYAITLGTLSAGSNYDLDFVAGASLTITEKDLTLAGAAVAIKLYDGDTDALITGTLSGVVGTDDVTFTGAGTFASAAIGTGIAVTPAITLGGADAGNYTFTQPTGLTGTIVAGRIAFAPVDYATAQSNSTVTLTLVRDGGPAATVSLRSEDGTAIAGVDYTDLDGTVINFAAGETSKPVTVTLIPKNEVNVPDRLFTVVIGTVTGGTAGDDSAATITILKPSLTVTRPTGSGSISDLSPCTVTGTARDVSGISRVTVSLNGGPEVNATLGTVDTDFTTPIFDWAPAGGLATEGQLDVSSIPATTTAPVVFSSVNSEAHDVQVTTSALSSSGFNDLLGESAWSLEGTTSSGSSTVQVKFCATGTNTPEAFTGVRFRFDDAEQYEVFADFSYFDENGTEVDVLWNDSVFSYSDTPIYNATHTEVENGASPQGGAQSGKWIQVNLGSTPVTGFKFALRRKSSSLAGTVIMSAVNGTSLPSGTEFSLNSVPWSLAIEPNGGTNTMVVTAYDLNDNAVSLTRTFNFTRRYQLAVSRTAPSGIALDTAGTVALTASPGGAATALTPVTADANPRTSNIVPGTTTVTLTATPKTGYIFTSWTGLPSGATILGNVATFAMPSSNTSVTAGFQAADVFAGAAGSGNSFGGLLLPDGATDTGNGTVGYLSGTLTATGVFSGRLLIDGITQTFTATFFGDGSGVFTVGTTKQGTLTFGGRTLSLSYNAGAGNDAITATLTNGAATNSGVARRTIYSATNLVPSALLNTSLTLGGPITRGAFTVALPAQEQSPARAVSTYPQGDGYLALTLTNAGAVTGTGVLADGTAVTLASTLISGNQCPIFVQLATPGQAATTKGGAFLGTLVFDTTQTDTDVAGTGLVWIRPDVSALTPVNTATAIAAAKLYSAGWPSGILVNAVGALYDKSKTIQAGLDLNGASVDLNGNPLSYEDGKLVLAQGKLATTITKQNFIVSGNTVTKLPTTDTTFTLAPVATTGAFSGTFRPNWSPLATALPLFRGILIQKGANRGGHGFFISNATGDNAPQAGDVDFTLEPFATAASPVATLTPSTVSATAPYTLTGTAGNARGLARVEISLNGGDPVNAVLGSPGTTGSVPYSLSIAPSLGQNTIVITAVDLRGNRSSTTLNLTFNQRFILSVNRSVPASLSADSVGTVALAVTPATQATALSPTTANANPRTAQVQNGATVSITATPKTGYAFSRWTGLPAGATTTGTVARFAMPTTDLSVTAEFVDPAGVFAGAAGTGNTFHGLIQPENGTATSNATVGYLSGTIKPTTGAFSGTVLMDGVSQVFNAAFLGNGTASFIVGKTTQNSLTFGGKSLTLSLNTGSGNDEITATVTTGSATSSGVARRAIYSATKTVSAALLNAGTTGFATLAFPSKSQSPALAASSYPQGDGFGTVTITNTGVITISGTLADNTAFSATSALVEGDECPFFAQVFTPGSTTSKGGSFGGLLKFDRAPSDSDLSGSDLLWIRPAVTQQTGATAPALATQVYTPGWPSGIKVDSVGALYNKASTVQTSLGLGALNATTGNAKLQFEGVKLTAPITKTNFNVIGNVATKIPATDSSFTLTLTGSAAGSFTGTIRTPLATALPSFKGIILQKGANQGGFGFFLSNASSDLDPESGGVSFGQP